MAIELPLFPLNAVLFPHMEMSLHIFEERYRVMMQDCRATGTTFGVVAIREGLEVGAPSVPHEVGTLAQLHEVELLPDGRYDLTIEGASRFRVESFSLTRPYLTGSIHYLEDGAAPLDDARNLARRVSAAFAQYVQSLQAFGVEQESDVSLPDEPERLSYVVAAALNVETARRQELLEIDSTAGRLRRTLELLRREAVLLQQMSRAQEGRRRAAMLN